MLVILITLIPLALAGYANYVAAKKAIVDGIVTSATSRIENSASRLQAWIELRKAEIQLMSRTDVVRFGSVAERNAYFNREIERSAGMYHTIGLSDRQGNLLRNTGQEVSVGDQVSYQQVLRGITIISDPFESSYSKEKLFVIMAPVYDEHERISGFVSASMLTDTLFRPSASGIQLQPHESISVYSGTGTLIYGPNKNEVMAVNLRDPQMPLHGKAADLLWKNKGMFEVGVDNKREMVFHTRVPGTSWLMVLQVPAADMMRPLQAIQWQAIVYIILAEFLVAGLAIMLFNRLIARISRVLAVTEEVAAGNFAAQPLRADSGDEIDQLALSVNGMMAHLRQMFERLEAIISQNALDIIEQRNIQKELAIAKREAEAANQAKSDFLARMSHEIRTPLNGIIGLSHLMRKSALDEVQLDYVDKINSSSEALLRIINDILDFSKIEAGKLTIEAMPFDPELAVQKLCDTLSVFMGSKQEVEFIASISPAMPATLIGDSLRIEQVLLNLCANAIKFTDRGIISLALDAEMQENGIAKVTFVVEDTGIGIAAEQLEHLFEPFTQADGTSRRRHAGSGLGLVIVKSLVERMEGSLHVKTELGKGSKFSFSLLLPVGDTAREQSPDRQQAAPKPLGGDAVQPDALGSGMSVWVVEDHPKVREHLLNTLAGMGCSGNGFDSWKTALTELCHAYMGESGAAQIPDLIMLDMEMADMYGKDTWQAFRMAAGEAGVLTIAMTTAYGRDELLKLPQTSRPSAILLKPTSKLGLQRCLQALQASLSERVIAEAGSGPALPRRSEGKILLVEDNRINELVAVQLLEKRGYQVGVAFNGVEALRLLARDTWDLILMDIHMPEMDGIETTRRIRIQPGLKEIPIIALTANVIAEDHERYLQAGMNDIVTKPIDVDLMYTLLDKYLLPAQGAGEGTAGQEAGANREAVARPDNPAKALPELPGFKLDEALLLVSGKRRIVIHMLKLFCTEYADFAQRLCAVLEAGDSKNAVRMAHSLKGAASALGSEELVAAAGTLEAMLKEGRTEEAAFSQLLDRVQQIIGQAIETINSQQMGYEVLNDSS